MRRLDGLEEALAGKLFDRTPDGFQATALAAELLPIAQGVEETLDEAERRLVGMDCLLYTSPSPRDRQKSRMPSSA